METIDILDVTVIEPRLKHPTIFEKFDSLQGGESFVIHNDHDPKPLYYQLLGERGNIFTWEYLENGPEWWNVKIAKLKTANSESPSTVGDMVAKDYRKAEVFKKYGIDFCCGGKKTLDKVCREQGLDIAQIKQELKSVELQPKSKAQDFGSWDIGFLSDYIINTHHNYVKGAMPAIYEYTQKVAKVHGQRHPEVLKIAAIFVNVIKELEPHMRKEEMILFPYIKQLAEAKKKEVSGMSSGFGTVQNPINMMEQEHDAVGRMMDEINQLSNGYKTPEDACTTYNLAFLNLKEFEEDLHQHIHLENNILFPKAIELEKELVKIKQND